MLAICHLRTKIVRALVATPAALDDEFLLTLRLIDTLAPGELRLLEACSECLPTMTMGWLNGVIAEARLAVNRARRAA